MTKKKHHKNKAHIDFSKLHLENNIEKTFWNKNSLKTSSAYE